MIECTSSAWAPWTLVQADSKRYARVKVLEKTVARSIGMRGFGIERDSPVFERRKRRAPDRAVVRSSAGAAGL